jgi:phosphoglycolate phosphatase-like HAD superfamily hydrolase
LNLRALVLWDIDGTLVDSAKLGRDAFLVAFERVTGAPPARLVPFAGRTDLEIAVDLLEQSGVAPDDGVVDAFEDALAGAMAELEDEVRRRGRAYPGAHEALTRLGREPGVVQGLLTGNIPANARVKLGAVGLDGLVDFDIGGYGSDHRVRSELVAIACARAERKLGVPVAPARAVLVGDTPLDVAAAHAGGAHAIGVATGPYSERELEEAGAEAVLPDLRDTEQLVAAVLAVG